VEPVGDRPGRGPAGLPGPGRGRPRDLPDPAGETAPRPRPLPRDAQRYRRWRGHAGAADHAGPAGDALRPRDRRGTGPRQQPADRLAVQARRAPPGEPGPPAAGRPVPLRNSRRRREKLGDGRRARQQPVPEGAADGGRARPARPRPAFPAIPTTAIACCPITGPGRGRRGDRGRRRGRRRPRPQDGPGGPVAGLARPRECRDGDTVMDLHEQADKHDRTRITLDGSPA
jgi:hypothetical protein